MSFLILSENGRDTAKAQTELTGLIKEGFFSDWKTEAQNGCF